MGLKAEKTPYLVPAIQAPTPSFDLHMRKMKALLFTPLI